ncbi:N-acyl amino acid synthase FeeM domain-containing protein [Aromatoleum diolicum]|uniref:N-acyl amino acid synthase FeeM catalytic core domain-containing protein n=1 Tax=Aromatoleum diolicum TaxID=75796 RepID=A0ABX1Q625_9RHOO|nr:hypothetical protein [Aromatoleum diolicum]NMG73823.1 hypothetical protein [Aromatoleum diolicum]
MWPIGFADPGIRQNRPAAGHFPTPCAFAGARTAACRAANGSGVCGFTCGNHCFGVAGRSVFGQIAALVERMYGRHGYQTTSVTRPPESPDRIAFGGSHRGTLFATLTLGLDTGEGLLVDELYGPEVDVFRGLKRKICELSTFAIDPQYSSHHVLASLFYLAYLYGRTLHKVTDAFIEVNPRHAGFYERVLHFRRIGEVRNCPRVDAPAVLLHLDLEHFEAQAAPFGETGRAPERAIPTPAHAVPHDAKRSPALAHP